MRHADRHDAAGRRVGVGRPPSPAGGELCRAAPILLPRARRRLATMQPASRDLAVAPRHAEPQSRRLLDVDVPAQPEVLVQLSLLLAEDDVDFSAASLLISSDMALAAAVLKAVNSAMYGLRGRVQSVQQAITYLGTREVASVTFEMGLRAVFPAGARARAGVGARARARPADGPDRAARWASTPGPRTRPGCSRNAARRSCSATPPSATGRCSPRRRTTRSC